MLPDQPHISVMLPIRNGMPHLKRTLEGLMSQTYRHFTLLVQDGLSTDGSLEYLRGLDTFFPINIVSERDGSVSIGYARAMKRATGDLVVPAACDEVLDPNALETYVRWYKEHPDAVYIYGGTRIFSGADEKMAQVFQPPMFNFSEYLHFRMCPSQAGAYNRLALHDQLYLDESLQTCPDFELLTRLALTFGEDRIIGKRDITMSARGDSASMTFRPESHAQFVRDKSKIIQRLISGPLREKFTDYLRRNMHYCLHSASAHFIYQYSGDCPSYAEHLMAAYKALPGRPALRQLVYQSRFLSWNETEHRPEPVAAVPPAAPDPALSQVAQALDVRRFIVSPAWAAQGAAVQNLPEGVEISTIKTEGYSATLPFETGALDFENNWHWLYLRTKVTRGIVNLTLSRFWKGPLGQPERIVVFQSPLYATPEPQVLFIPIAPGSGTVAILIGNSGVMTVERLKEDSQSQIAILSAAVIKMPKDNNTSLPPSSAVA